MADYATMIGVDDARQRFSDLCRSRPVGVKQVPLTQALGRVMAEPLHATTAVPPFDNSAMDGFALRSVDLDGAGGGSFALLGTMLAGSDTSLSIGPGECVRVTTGAAIPDGADTVVIKEQTSVDGGRVLIGAGQKAGSNIRRSGEDIASGAVVLPAGRRIGPAELGVIASVGAATVTVRRAVRVVLVTTGDELVMPGMPLGGASIYNSNGYSLGALLLHVGAELAVPDMLVGLTGVTIQSDSVSALCFVHARDEPETLRTVLSAAADIADIIITSGGVSAGEADHLPSLVEEIGSIEFWKVRMRPGMPLLGGLIGDTPIVGLPGNPVSGYASVMTIVAPGVRSMQHCNEQVALPALVRLSRPLTKKHDRTEFMRATATTSDDGALLATPIQRQGSGVMSGVVEADGLIVLDAERREFDTGQLVPWIPIRQGL